MQAKRSPISQAWRDAQLNDPLVAIDWQELTQLRFERADTLQGEVGVIASTFDAQLPEHIASSGKVFVAFDSRGFSGWDGRRQPFARDRATTRRGQPLAFGLPTACHSRARIPVEGGPRGPMACISAPSLGRLHLRRWQSRSFAQ